jgi:hypothetical protein
LYRYVEQQIDNLTNHQLKLEEQVITLEAGSGFVCFLSRPFFPYKHASRRTPRNARRAARHVT